MLDPDIDPDITGHRITDATMLTPDASTQEDQWFSCEWLNAHPPQNAPTLYTEPPLSACGRHPTDWGTQASRR
ncbi:MAG: hypothetical protein M3228_11520 [Actinomycetota bacterium]|nr:hypothetical protein [Actinomycetota bacterium]